MKNSFKRILSAVLCLVLLTGILGTSAFAIDAGEYKDLSYDCYTYLGDSVSWGYGLSDIDSDDPAYVFKRINGSFTDIIADTLEAVCGTKVNCAACSGTRMSDFRVLLETGMGFENPYPGINDWYGGRHPARTAEFLTKGKLACDYIRESDLITLEVGLNDLTGTLVDTLSACGFIDPEKLTAISDVNSAIKYLAYALDSAGKTDILGSMLSELDYSLNALRENASEVLKHVVTLAPADADIIFVGYYNAFANVSVIPGSSTSLIFGFLKSVIFALNDYFAELASRYDNVHFVAVPEVSTFFSKGTDIVDLLNGDVEFLLGIHPDIAGNEALAKGVLDKLRELNTCHHLHTRTVADKISISRGYQYVTSTVCTDCGKVLDMGKLETPLGTLAVPVYTVRNILTYVEKTVSAAVGILGRILGIV